MLVTAKAYDIGALSIHHTRPDADVVARVRSAGLGIGGHGAHEDQVIRKMLDFAVDVFTTDRPDRGSRSAANRSWVPALARRWTTHRQAALSTPSVGTRIGA